jgi:hypothetical protein
MLTLLTNINTVVSKYLAKLQSIKPGGKVYEEAMHVAADGALTATRARIHERGQAADGSAIGAYSTTPMYVSAADAKAPNPGDPIGKTGKTVFANGNPHKSRYFAGGYNEYKTAIGLNAAGSVNLTLTGEMRDTYEVIKTADGYGLGWDDDELSKRAAALEDRYGKKIWTLTADERKALIDTVTDKLHIGE